MKQSSMSTFENNLKNEKKNTIELAKVQGLYGSRQGDFTVGYVGMRYCEKLIIWE